MNDLFFSALDVACIIDNFDLTLKSSAELIFRLWNEDKNFLQPQYRRNYKKFFLDVRYWSGYLYDKVNFDKEFPAIQKDCGGILNDENFVTDDFNFDLFFKSLRVRILYIGDKNFARMKLRTLLAVYGYKRRSSGLVRYLQDCLLFYRIQTFLRGNVSCDVEEINLDDMITFRVI